MSSANDFLKVGDEVEAVILTLDREERKMSLGIKQLKPDPWATIDTKYAVGTKHTAKVRNFTNFGVFAELEEGVDGLIHISDLSWTKKIKHPSEFTQLGSDINENHHGREAAQYGLTSGNPVSGLMLWFLSTYSEN